MHLPRRPGLARQASRSIQASRSALAAAALVPALVLSGCGSDDGSPGTTVTTSAENTSNTSTPVDDGPPAGDVVGVPLYEDVSPLLDAARDEFGETEVSVLYVYADEALLTRVDPSAPRSTTLRHLYQDGEWTDETRIPHPSTGRTLPLDDIDPDTIRALVQAAPEELEVEDFEVDHVAIGTSDSGEQEYVVSLNWDGGLGRVTFGPDGQVLEIRSSR